MQAPGAETDGPPLAEPVEPPLVEPPAAEPVEPPLVEPTEPTEPTKSTKGVEASEPLSETEPAEADVGTSTPVQFFSPTSFWNTKVPAGAPLDPASAAMAGALDSLVNSELAEKTGPAINTVQYSVPIYTVPAGQPTVPVTLVSPYLAPALRAAFAAVPLPPTAQAAAGNDHHLVVWQPSTDRLWEFWHLYGSSGNWTTDWGGAIEHVSQNEGAYGPSAWAGATAAWGASASGLSIAGGLITFGDLERGRIEHALSISLPVNRSSVYYLPAHRTDGKSSDPLKLPEGAHLRLDPNLDIARLNLPPLTRMIAEAAQRYGFFVRDTAGTVCFNAQDPINLGRQPYLGPTGYFGGSYPRQLLTSFPWNRLQVLAAQHGTVAPH